MNIVRLTPWNWFKREDDIVPVRHGRPHAGMRMYDPLYEMNRLFDSLMSNAGRSSAERTAPGTEPALFHPNLDVTGNDKQYVVSVELPGVEEKDVLVELENDALRIYGEKKQEVEEKKEGANGASYYRMERSYGSFQRMLTLPEDVDTSAIKAVHKDGVLTITLPRREAALPENRKIAINQ